MLCHRHTSPIVKGRDMLIADLEPIYVDDPSTAFAAAWEELMMLLQSGRLASVGICVRFPDGAEHEIAVGETEAERAVILHRVRSAMARSRH